MKRDRSVEHGDVNVMIWGCFVASGTRQCVVTDELCVISKDRLMIFWASVKVLIFNQKWIFQWDMNVGTLVSRPSLA